MKFTRSCFALILAVLMLSSTLCIASFADDAVLTPTKINTTRGDGDLIVYTPAFGATTNTNEWGAEAVIGADGKCIYVGTDGNNTIPEGGFVVSGHDSDDKSALNKTLVLNTFKVGMYAAFNETLMKITVSDQPITATSDYEIKLTIDGTNCSRYEDQLILYTRAGQPTGTNVWGYEVVVTDGVVTAIGGNNSIVPTEPNSCVLSGHGTKAQQLRDSIVLGMTVTSNGSEYTFKYDSAAAAVALKITLGRIKEKLEDARSSFAMIDYDAAEKQIINLENSVNAALDAYKKDSDSDALNKKCKELTALCAKISNSMCESPAVEYRGVWIRPTQTTAKDVDEYVQRLYDAGINSICIETLYDSCMIMPMPEDSLFKQNPKWAGFDMLQAFIDSCHKRGMELHIWMPIFYVGHGDGANKNLSVGTKKPEWLSKNNVGKFFPSDTNEQFYMIDPSNSEACDFLIDTYKYILETYDIDGFEMDYIRYWANGAEDWGYNEGLLKAFKDKYGVTPQYDTSASYWSDWCDFRASYVTAMVYRIRELVDQVKPGVLLTADVAADEHHSKRGVYQYYHEWLKAGVIDVLHPMAYGNSYYDRITEINEMCGDNCYLAVGLGTYDSEILTDALVEHTEHIVNVGGNGAVFFEAASYLARNLYSSLEAMYSSRAVVPTAENAITLFINAESKRIDELMVPSGALSADLAAELKSAFAAYAASGRDDADALNTNKETLYTSITSVQNEAARKKLTAAANTLTRMMYINDRIDRDYKAPDVVEIPVTPSTKPDTSNNVSVSEDTSSDESDVSGGEKPAGTDPIVIIVVVTVAALLIIAIVTAVIIKKNGKK